MRSRRSGNGEAPGEEPGAVVFLPGEAEGAYALGSRVARTDYQPGDGPHTEGDQATVIASHGPVILPDVEEAAEEFGYFVIWDDMPGVPVFVRGRKLRPIEREHESNVRDPG